MICLQTIVIVLGGELNVDFCCDWAHTALLNSFCDEADLTPVIRHAACTCTNLRATHITLL